MSNFRKDISDQKSTYTYWLTQNWQKLTTISEDRTVSCDSFKQQVLEMITKAHDTEAKRRFINTLTSKRTKTDAIFYVYNSMMCGSGCGII